MDNPEQSESPFDLLRSSRDTFMGAFVQDLMQQLSNVKMSVEYIEDEIAKTTEDLDRKFIEDTCKNLHSTIEHTREILNVGLEYDKRQRAKK